jgi:hypothetical protein
VWRHAGQQLFRYDVPLELSRWLKAGLKIRPVRRLERRFKNILTMNTVVRGQVQVAAQIFDAQLGPTGLLCEVDLPVASILRIQITAPLFCIAEMSSPGRLPGLIRS